MIFVQKGKVGLKVKKELINQGQWQIFDNGEQNCLERGAWGILMINVCYIFPPQS